MATYYHPVTGVLLNHITVQRSSLGWLERQTVRHLRREGLSQQQIAARLGTNQGRVNEALTDDDDDGEGGAGGQGSLF
ncbi:MULTISPECIES: hypothetical protein [Paracoccus]|uniref:hypothetical protein n=1 Tax=Paracoccus TaxID=265 RepID=UPI001E5D2F4A|nr:MULTISPECIES: hypothetical protein [Paracoccus]UFS65294.1 hypothetical protein LO749_01620 [Paracoccus denitrificans]